MGIQCGSNIIQNLLTNPAHDQGEDVLQSPLQEQETKNEQYQDEQSLNVAGCNMLINCDLGKVGA